MASKISARYIAHRGGLTPRLVQHPEDAAQYENTLQAFTDALKADIKDWETDCQVTKDGFLVFFHNDLLPDGKPISSYTRADLRAKYPDIPDAEEVLLLARGNEVNVTIDAKNADKAKNLDGTSLEGHDDPRNHILLVDKIVELRMQNQVIVGGFSTKITDEMRERAQIKHRSEIATSPAFGGIAKMLGQYALYQASKIIPGLPQKLLRNFRNANKFAAYQMPANAGIKFFTKDQQGKQKFIQMAFGSDVHVGTKLLSRKPIIAFIHELGTEELDPEVHFWGYAEEKAEILRLVENGADAVIGDDRKTNIEIIGQQSLSKTPRYNQGDSMKPTISSLGRRQQSAARPDGSTKRPTGRLGWISAQLETTGEALRRAAKARTAAFTSKRPLIKSLPGKVTNRALEKIIGPVTDVGKPAPGADPSGITTRRKS